MGALMARAGYDVTLHARGPHLRAMQEKGVRVISADDDFVAHPRLVSDLKDAGPVDVIFLCVKAHGLPPLAAQLPAVLGPETTVVSTQNGIPWWYFQGDAGPMAGTRLERVDPGGVVSEAIEARRVVGSLIYFSTEITEPGVVKHNEGNRISLGEPDGQRTVGEHKTSMLQDLEAGRPLELEAIVGAVLEVGERIGLPMPHTRAVYACTKLLAGRRGAAAQKIQTSERTL